MAITELTPILNVSDVPASLEWFEKLGFQRSFTWNDEGSIEGAALFGPSGPATFAGVCVGSSTLFLCMDGQGGRGEHGMWMSLWVDSPDEVDGLHARFVASGGQAPLAPQDEPWGVRECHLQHPDGHVLRVSAGLPREEA